MARTRVRLSPMRFVLAFGLISALADVVYEGGRSIYGPFLGALGASALLVSVITGGGEAVALVGRLIFGRLADRPSWRWPLAITGYGLTVIAVPLLGLTNALWLACVLLLLERLGKAVRSPAKDTMLAQAGTTIGRGWAFGVHEAMDQSGAFVGPLIIAAAFALTGAYSAGFLVLVIPGVAVMVVLFVLRRRVPDTGEYEPLAPKAVSTQLGLSKEPLPRQFWVYSVFSALTMFGYATFGLLAFHLATNNLVPIAVVPVVYAGAMAIDAVTALGAGKAYDRIGLKGLVVLPILAALVPWLGFSSTPWLAITGVLIWGAALGIQESTMRAAVADLAPAARRGSAYGTFSAIYGVSWLAGSVLIGLLYERSYVLTAIAITIAQVGALVAFGWLRVHVRTVPPEDPYR